MAAPTVSETALRNHVDAWLSSARGPARTLLVRAQPIWVGSPTITVRGRIVHVVEGVSGLAALDAMRTTPHDDLVVILTALPERELGSAVVLDSDRRRVTELDEWSMVPALFGVRDQNVPRHVSGMGAWMPELLLSLRPDRGYPPAPGAVLTPDHVVRSLLMALLGLGRIEDLDLMTCLTPLDDPGVRARLRELGPKPREGLIDAVSHSLGQPFVLALRAAIAGRDVSVIAVGLVCAELWAADAGSPDAVAARVRIERYIGTSATTDAARRYGDAARRLTRRRLAGGGAQAVLDQADALCAEFDWEAGAAASAYLPTGLHARVTALATAIHTAADSSDGSSAADVDRALAAVHDHHAAVIIPRRLATAEMAVRLVRWLHTERATPANLADAVHGYAADGAWAERALGDIWDGDNDAALASAYEHLAHAVQQWRRAQDRAAADLLTGTVGIDPSLPAIEDLLQRVVVPLSTHRPVLLIVLDGMSAATATELAAELPTRGWTELVADAAGRRLAALAVLPTITEYSRTSLFAGERRGGNQQTEKARFAAVAGGVVFHKDDLRADAGYALPPAVTTAISDSGRALVGVVLNTIDDALATAEVDALRWNLDQIANLPALLDAARGAGRIVILTSDHGHIVERGSTLRGAPGAAARFRDPSTGPAQSDEVLVQGPRVLAPGGTSVLAVSDGVRFAAKRAGYHGGAALAEITIPVVVAQPAGASSPSGWSEAPPQEPRWWNEPARSASPTQPPAPSTKRRTHKPSATSAPALFDELPAAFPTPAPVSAALDEHLVTSSTYRGRQQRGGRHPLSDATVRAIIAALFAGGGRAHRDTLAAAAGVTAAAFPGMLAALRRLLNVDGYAVIDLDADQVTVTLNETLLREQFGLEGRP